MKFYRFELEQKLVALTFEIYSFLFLMFLLLLLLALSLNFEQK